jgi:hypothetical protein
MMTPTWPVISWFGLRPDTVTTPLRTLNGDLATDGRQPAVSLDAEAVGAVGEVQGRELEPERRTGRLERLLSSSR